MDQNNTPGKITNIDPLFKGCTRPAMIMGVPMVPLLAVSVMCFLPGMWILIFIGQVGLILIFGVLPINIWLLREITKKDDHRLNQLILRITLRLRQSNRSHWGKGITAYSPIKYRRSWR